ncbi:helix-turn-helix domain-containing protein [Intestinibacter bartlettii]|jgi:transcriptional regulator with XRE-family HTH domain|uniref:helix-turn-helix domain-containing protein n=1 Tax=Intestinibacter bartlettii TaxID=261299 RepID=UPI0020630A8C|nr:helix-turn-helix transcriptional regulator [Intestinibacter bartlettii]MBS4974309.1 helix-turn-helix transcriptional regulator [Clostridium celatum]DAY51139.1 MAG TPA: helix-turn-helix domain protein [Caudoviricetes sp.]
MDKLGERLKALRKEHRYTQEFLADYLNVTRPAIGNYEKGINEPPLQTLVKLADLYQVSLDWLAGRTNVKYNFNLESKENRDAIIKIHEALKGFEIKKR